MLNRSNDQIYNSLVDMRDKDHGKQLTHTAENNEECFKQTMKWIIDK